MSSGLSKAKVKGIMRVEITATKEKCILTVFDRGNGRMEVLFLFSVPEMFLLDQELMIIKRRRFRNLNLTRTKALTF
jgi:hypothetical protein